VSDRVWRLFVVSRQHMKAHSRLMRLAQDHSCSRKDVVVAVPTSDTKELEKENQALQQKNMSYREELRLLRSHLASSQQRESNMYDSREAMENELIEAKEGAAKEIARLRGQFRSSLPEYSASAYTDCLYSLE